MASVQCQLCGKQCAESETTAVHIAPGYELVPTGDGCTAWKSVGVFKRGVHDYVETPIDDVYGEIVRRKVGDLWDHSWKVTLNVFEGSCETAKINVTNKDLTLMGTGAWGRAALENLQAQPERSRAIDEGKAQVLYDYRFSSREEPTGLRLKVDDIELTQPKDSQTRLSDIHEIAVGFDFEWGRGSFGKEATLKAEKELLLYAADIDNQRDRDTPFVYTPSNLSYDEAKLNASKDRYRALITFGLEFKVETRSVSKTVLTDVWLYLRFNWTRSPVND